MNDKLFPDVVMPAAAGSATPAAPGPATAGGLIRAARQAQGVDLAALAAMLKIPLRKLDALENGRHEELQGPTFERALAQAACRALKVDPKPILALMPQYAGGSLERVASGLNTPFRERQGRSDGGDPPFYARPVLILPALIVLAALALFYVPTGLWERLSASSFATGTPAAAPPPGEGTSTTAIVLPGATPDAAAPARSPAPAAGLDTETPSAMPAPAVAAAPASAVDEVLAHVQAAPTIPLQVVANKDSWVEVLDAQGHALLSRTVVAGESVGLDGAMPMHVKIGNALDTRLTLRGDNVDLAPYTRDNVARLELK